MLELRCNIAPDEAYFYTKHVVREGGRVSGGGKARGEGFWGVEEVAWRGVSAVSCLYKIGRHNNQDRF
jgi:hypothetical protein